MFSWNWRTEKLELSGQTKQSIGVICLTILHLLRMLDYVLTNSGRNDFVDLTIEKRATSLETISNLTTWKTHATSSVHKAHKKVVHDNNGDEE